MAWLIGLVCVVLVIKFWRIFLPLGLIAAAAIGVFLLYENQQTQERLDAERRRLEQKRLRVDGALNRAAKTDARWEVLFEVDPASGKNVPRSARVTSDGGLCHLQVEQRVNGTRLAGIYCDGLPLQNKYSATTAEVKFDNRETSDSMALARFSDGDDSYIGSSQPNGNLAYSELIERLATAKRVALLLNFEDVGQRWTTFSLLNADQALVSIGAWKAKSDTAALR